VLDDDGANPPNPSFDLRDLQALVRHPQGAVAVWTRRSSSSNFNDDIVVSRLGNAGWETPQKVFDVPTAFANASVATNDAGEILLAATLLYPPSISDVRTSIAPSLSAPWPDLTLLSPQATPTKQVPRRLRSRRWVGVLRGLGRARRQQPAHGGRLDEVRRGCVRNRGHTDPRGTSSGPSRSR
jgi:hypothetical protein